MKHTTPFFQAVIAIAGKDLRADSAPPIDQRVGLFALMATMVSSIPGRATQCPSSGVPAVYMGLRCLPGRLG